MGGTDGSGRGGGTGAPKNIGAPASTTTRERVGSTGILFDTRFLAGGGPVFPGDAGLNLLAKAVHAQPHGISRL